MKENAAWETNFYYLNCLDYENRDRISHFAFVVLSFMEVYYPLNTLKVAQRF